MARDEVNGIAAALRAVLPADCVLERAEERRPYECDALTAFRELPAVVVLPRTEEQVRQTLLTCHRLNVPIVARGSGTGLSGGATPHPAGVLLSCARMKRVLEVDPVNRIARLESGVPNLKVSEAAARHGLYYAPDPSSQVACSIGGNVAENSGGVHCLKYGLTVHNLRRVRAALVTGEVIELGSEALDAPGYDLLALITGSEGLLAVILEVTVKLTPRPQDAKCVMAAFDDVAKACGAVAGIIGAGIVPAGLEMMDRLTISAVEPFVNAGYPQDAEAILLCESDGTVEEAAEEAAVVRGLMLEHGATSLEVSRNEEQRARFWSGRKAAFPAAGRISPDYYCMDGTIPRRALGSVLVRIAELAREYDLPCMNVFHAGDGNLHPLILYDANRPGDIAKTQAFGAKILELCIEAGGTITGEHGVGVEKIGDMCVQFTPQELERFHAVKRAFDAEGLLNPRKAVPTLHRCAQM